MCVLSVVMSDALNWPPSKLQDPAWKEHLERWMKIAKKYDFDHAQVDCETEDKRKALEAKAKESGVELMFPDEIGEWI